MLAEERLHKLASHLRSLLECRGVSLLLGCSDATLRHPLLDMLAPRYTCPVVYGSQIDLRLLQEERVRALSDIAIQTGLAQYTDDLELMGEIRSLATLPLERAGGILGIFLCVDQRRDAFQEGERLLIEQHLPALVNIIEDTLRNLSASAMAEVVARDILQEQSVFISLVSHELRVPLTAIKGYAGLLQAYSSSTKQQKRLAASMTAELQRQYLDTIMDQTKHLEILIGDLLDISRMQTGRLSLKYTEVNIAQVCWQVAQLVRIRFDEQQQEKYSISCHIDPELPQAWADPHRLQQVLTNLVENAVKYSPHGGPIEIFAYTVCRKNTYIPATYAKAGRNSSADGREICVQIRDQGVGIPVQQQALLFRPFTRLEHPATRNISGIGLGLYIAHKLVEAMQGRLILESSEGQGTSVTFTLPIHSSSSIPASQSPVVCRG